MATMPRFPNIPEVEAGQALGATYLNSLARGCEHLLGISHASYGLPHATAELTRTSVDYGTMATSWMLHTGDYVFCWFYAGESHGAQTWYVKLQYFGDDDDWHTAYEWSGTDGFPEARADTLNLSAEAQITIGKIYQWRWQGKMSGSGSYVSLQVMLLMTCSPPSGWVAPPLLAAGASDPDGLNAYRTDLLVLNAFVPPTNTLSYCETTKVHTHTMDEWHAFTRYAYRYRPNGLYAAIWGDIAAGGWGWRVRFADLAGNVATVFDEDDLPSGTGDYQLRTADIDLTAGDAAANLAAAGITLSMGLGYQVTIEAKRQSATQALNLKQGMMLRTSSGVAGGSWANNKLWAHKDTDVGPTQLNKVRTDLLELYTGGAEELWGDSHAAPYVAGEERPVAGVHRLRYLMYYCATGETPSLLYGQDFAEEYGLTAGEDWLYFDLASIELPLGGSYYVKNVACAFEADGVYGEA